MLLNDQVCYRALRARDSRFDGRFFVGVRTTGIYCRPVCTARTPRASSCRFFQSPAVAEQQGFRPCLICRPEIAPGQISGPTLAHALHERLRQGAVRGESLEALSRDCGYSSRQVRRLILDTFGVTPVELAQTERLLFAKRLIQETALPMLEVAQSSGFRSLRRFNALFATRYGMAPGAVRRRTIPPRIHDGVALRLTYRPPFAWAALLAYLGGRATPGVEQADPQRYVRTVEVDSCVGWIEVRQSIGDALEVVASPSLAPALSSVLARLRQVFDLDAEPQLIAEHLRQDRFLRPHVTRHPGQSQIAEHDVRRVTGVEKRHLGLGGGAGGAHAVWLQGAPHGAREKMVVVDDEHLPDLDPVGHRWEGRDLARTERRVGIRDLG